MTGRQHHKQVEYKAVYYGHERSVPGEDLNAYLHDVQLTLRKQICKVAQANNKLILPDTYNTTFRHEVDGSITVRLSAWTISKETAERRLG